MSNEPRSDGPIVHIGMPVAWSGATRPGVSTNYMQLAPILRPTAGIRSRPGSTSTRDRYSLPVHGGGTGTLAGYHRNRSTQLGKVFQAHPDSATQQSQHRLPALTSI